MLLSLVVCIPDAQSAGSLFSVFRLEVGSHFQREVGALLFSRCLGVRPKLERAAKRVEACFVLSSFFLLFCLRVLAFSSPELSSSCLKAQSYKRILFARLVLSFFPVTSPKLPFLQANPFSEHVSVPGLGLFGF